MATTLIVNTAQTKPIKLFAKFSVIKPPISINSLISVSSFRFFITQGV
jgi:hypothetical protein